MVGVNLAENGIVFVGQHRPRRVGPPRAVWTGPLCGARL